MPICKPIQVTRQKICTGDMDQQVDILRRDILPPGIGDIDPRVTFTSILKPWAAVKTSGLSGGNPRRFEGINIEDQPTHDIFINWDSTIWPLDSDNNFVLLEDGRRLRIVGAEDINEQKLTIRMLCTERGVASLAGSEA